MPSFSLLTAGEPGFFTKVPCEDEFRLFSSQEKLLDFRRALKLEITCDLEAAKTLNASRKLD